MGKKRVVAVTHGYPPGWNMGGEVALHRLLEALPADRYDKVVLTNTQYPYNLGSSFVLKLNAPTTFADPSISGSELASQLLWNHSPAIREQLATLKPDLVIVQNELSLATVEACNSLGVPSLISVHTPPKYGAGVREAVFGADYRIFNTQTSATEWGFPSSLVVHPAVSHLPTSYELPQGAHYTLLSSLGHKGVGVVAKVAAKLPDRQFLVVRSPATAMERLDLVEGVPNISVKPRVHPEEVPYHYFSKTRILLVPGRYETYGMSAIEAAGYGIPSVHVDTPHVREGIAHGANLVPPLSSSATLQAILEIEHEYADYSLRARVSAEELWGRQQDESAEWAEYARQIIGG